MVSEKIKKAPKSKTIQGNLFFMLVFLLSQFVFISAEEQGIILDFVTAPETQVFVTVIYNIIMRFFTNSGLEDK